MEYWTSRYSLSRGTSGRSNAYLLVTRCGGRGREEEGEREGGEEGEEEGRGEEEGEGERERGEGEVEEGEEERRHDSGNSYSAATDTHESVTFEVNLIIRHGSAYLSWNSCTHTI